MNWYLLQAKPNLHNIACANLKQQGFEVFLPLMVKTSKKGIKFTNYLKPLFSTYLFLGTDLDNIPWKSINATRGVSKAVTLDGQYRPLHNQIIEGMKLRCDHNGILKTMERVATGDRVKIERGPFTDFICTVDKVADEKRAWVLIDILKGKIRTKMSIRNITRID